MDRLFGEFSLKEGLGAMFDFFGAFFPFALVIAFFGGFDFVG